MLLYDMLNDDDDELRALSAPVASWILSYSPLFPAQNVSLSAVPASKSLAEFIAITYSSQEALFGYCVERLMEQTILHKHHNNIIFTPLQTLFNDHCKESTILFEVEKQNLFIDDVQEIDVWTKVLRRLDRSVHHKDVINKLAQWASEGLEFLKAKMAPSTDGQQDNVLGWTSKPEIYALGALLFNVASLLVFISAEQEAEVAGRDNNVISSESLTGSLKTLHERGQSLILHPRWLNRIEAAISAKEGNI